MKNFGKARNLFKDFRSKIEDNKEVLNDFVKAIDKLINEYDTAIYENRFIVGGAVEYIFIALLRYLGFEVEHIGRGQRRVDIKINGIDFSIKTNFTGRGDIRLINRLGNKEILWTEPTIFIISELGIVYADPDFLDTYDKGDAIVTNVNEIQRFVGEKPEYAVKVNIPKKAVKSKGYQTRLASLDIAKTILNQIKSELINYLG